MLLLVTLALVVASAVLLVLGFVQDALGFIYLSMLCAGVAALALFVFARLAKRRGTALAGAAVGGGSGSPYASDRPGPERRPATERPRPGRTGTAKAGPVAEPVPDAAFDEPGDEAWSLPEDRVAVPSRAETIEDWTPESDTGEQEAVPVAAAVPSGARPWSAVGAQDEDTSDDWGDEVVFPIADYDELRVAEVLPLLSQLDPDELQEVRDRELAGKARATILDRIDDRLGRRRTPAPPPREVTTSALPVVPAAEVQAAEAAPGGSDVAAPAPAPAGRTSKAAKAPAAKAPAVKRAAAKKTPARRAPAQKRVTPAAPASPAAEAPVAVVPLAGVPVEEPAPAPTASAPTAPAGDIEPEAEAVAPGIAEAVAAPPVAAPPVAAPPVAAPPAGRPTDPVAPSGAAPAAPAPARRSAKKVSATGEGGPAKKAAGARKAAGSTSAKKAAPAKRPAKKLLPPE